MVKTKCITTKNVVEAIHYGHRAKDGNMESKGILRCHIIVWGHYEFGARRKFHFPIPYKQEVALIGEILATTISGSKRPVESCDEVSQIHAKWDIHVPADHKPLIHRRREVP